MSRYGQEFSGQEVVYEYVIENDEYLRDLEHEIFSLFLEIYTVGKRLRQDGIEIPRTGHAADIGFLLYLDPVGEGWEMDGYKIPVHFEDMWNGVWDVLPWFGY